MISKIQFLDNTLTRRVISKPTCLLVVGNPCQSGKNRITTSNWARPKNPVRFRECRKLIGFINFNENYNLELEHAKHKIHADSFRSFDINGLDAKFNRTSVNLIVNF
jgi:hypothetical protein